MTYEVTLREDADVPYLRGVSHQEGDGYRIGPGNPHGVPVRIVYYAVDERLADLFESDCEASNGVLAYKRLEDKAGAPEKHGLNIN